MNNGDSTTPLGLVELTNAQYHSGPGLSSTQLKRVKVPLEYWDTYLNPDREPQEFKHCFAVGDGTHKIVLEPGTFEKTYAVGFDKSAFPGALDTIADMKKELAARNLAVSGSKPELADRLVEDGFDPGKILLFLEKQHLETMKGRIPIPATDYKNMMGMLRSVERSEAGALLQGAETEQSYFWRDENGVLRKCRTDAITADGNVVLDLKTTDDVSEDGFGVQIARYGYHVSAAWYMDILRGLYGDQAPSLFAFIAVQKKRPYDVAVHYLTEQHLHLGRLIYRKLLRTLMQCMETNVWPGAARGKFIEAKLPAWEMNRLAYLEAEEVA